MDLHTATGRQRDLLARACRALRELREAIADEQALRREANAPCGCRAEKIPSPVRLAHHPVALSAMSTAADHLLQVCEHRGIA
jgi:hypothetical protein